MMTNSPTEDNQIKSNLLLMNPIFVAANFAPNAFWHKGTSSSKYYKRINVLISDVITNSIHV